MFLFTDIVKAVLLGVVEGVTEFLPISSTGHLILAGNLLSFTGERAKAFEIFIQLGAILSVVWLYRAKIFSVIRDFGNAGSTRFITNIIIAFLPAAIIGLAVHSWIKLHLFNTVTVAAALIVGGLIMLFIEKTFKTPISLELDGMSPRSALGIGIAQVFSLFPGVSRSGATIMGGLVMGLDRKTATEFSFFLAIPTMFAATLYDLLKNLNSLSAADIPVFGAGFTVAFIAAMLVIRAFLGFVTRHSFSAFAYYRIIFGAIVLLMLR